MSIPEASQRGLEIDSFPISVLCAMAVLPTHPGPPTAVAADNEYQAH